MSAAWIPNVFTFANLACGFVSVIFAGAGSAGDPAAAVLILLAALLDGLDGQVARRLGVASSLGKELDSLADCVTFGVSPGYLAYKTYLEGIGALPTAHPFSLGALIAVIFPICAAYRLARFNVQYFSGSFKGLPSPVAASLVALVPLCVGAATIPKPLFAVFFLLVAFLMVSTVNYSKPQSFILKNLRGLKLAGIIVLFIFLLFRFGFKVLFILIGLYVLSGLVRYVIKTIEEHRY